MGKRTLFVVFVIFICPGIVWAQESLQTAQALYASASYDEALAMLERLQKQPLPSTDAVELQQNRALCLLALGRTADAEEALAAVVKTDPTYRPAEATTAPRVRTMFKDVRSKLLASVIVSVYNDARAQYDQRQFADALKGFQQVQRPQKIASVLTHIGSEIVLDFHQPSAELAGRIWGDLERTGQPIGLADPMIAAVALTHDLELATGNIAHYQRIQQLGYPLTLANWRI